MAHRQVPGLPKWPFLLGDGLLLTLAWWISWKSPDPFAFWPLLLMSGAVGAGAWLLTIPFLAQYRAALRLSEAESLTSVVGQVQQLQSVGSHIAAATGQWQDIQEKAAQTTTAAREIAQRISTEAAAFQEFAKRLNDSEKARLRLESEKWRRAEGEWIQVLVTLLDHTYALHQAATRSGKGSVVQQIGQFQRACRDAARRIGLVPVEVPSGEPFQATEHLLHDSKSEAPAGARIAETLASGYTYQGRPIRQPVVRLQTEGDRPAQAGELFPLAPEGSTAPAPASTPDPATSVAPQPLLS